MSELRLVPTAIGVWAATLAGILAGPWAAAASVVILVGAIALLRDKGQVVLTAGLSTVAAVVTELRCATARNWQFTPEIRGRLSTDPTPLDSGGYLVRLSVDGLPGRVPAFVPDLPDGAATGAIVQITGSVSPSSLPAVVPVAYNGQADLIAEPTGVAAWAQHVREVFATSVEHTVGESAEGLIPGMVLGDTSLQTPAEQQNYIDTGLSHLSAVSGSNVAVVTTAAALLASALRLGLRGRIAFSAAALTVFATLVGPEPSVLRASVTGLVGLTAVLASSRAEPVHALCLAVIGLVLVDSDMAISYGFALSVAATVGIVALSPLLVRALAPTGWPRIAVKALSVAIAADVVTMPIVALMSGQVSLVSVIANVVVAPVTAPITILGLVAVIFSLLPGGLEALLLVLISPLASWVHRVAEFGAGLSFATLETSPLVVLVVYGWIIAGILLKRPRLTVLCLSGAVVLTSGGLPFGRPIDPAQLQTYVVAEESEIGTIPPHTQVVVVLEGGTPHDRPVITPTGLPVVYPNRDGVVRLYADGSQRSSRGGF